MAVVEVDERYRVTLPKEVRETQKDIIARGLA